MSEPVVTPVPSSAPSLGRQLRDAVAMLLAMTVLTGAIYPLVVSGLGRIGFMHQTSGSLLTENGKVVGSRLIGQPFDEPKYFWSRLSATTPSPYNAQASGASNLGPTNPALTDAAKARIDALRAADPGNDAAVPVDLVTASGSGLDPHISPAAAEYQVRRVARARHLDEQRVRQLVVANTDERQLLVLGEPGVNVLALNLALDQAEASTPPR